MLDQTHPSREDRVAASAPPVAGQRLLRAVHPFRRARELGPVAVGNAVHGLVIFTAVIGAAYLAAYPAGRILFLGTVTTVLLWAAHVYSAVLGHRHVAAGPLAGTLPAVVSEMRQSLGMLRACILPAAPLAAAALGLLPLSVAYGLSLGVALLSLSTLGFVALHDRGAPLARCLGSAFAAGGLGAVIILAETLWH